MKMVKRVISALLCVALLWSNVPLTILASEMDELREHCNAYFADRSHAEEDLYWNYQPADAEAEYQPAVSGTDADAQDAWDYSDTTDIPNEYNCESEDNTATDADSILTFAVEAYDVAKDGESSATSGVCGENLTWTLENGTLTISGEGPMLDFGSSEAIPWYASRDTIQIINVGDGVTYIGDRAFLYCPNLEEVYLADSILEIADYAFYGAEALKTITLPSQLSRIGLAAFYECTALEAIHFHENIETIGEGAFMYCSSLADISFSDGREKRLGISTNAFRECTAVASIQFPEGVDSIGESAFKNCTNLQTAIIPFSVWSMGLVGESFEGCKKLVLHVQKYSYAHDYAVSERIPYTFYEPAAWDNVLDSNDCSLQVTREDDRAHPTIQVHLNYSILETAWDSYDVDSCWIYFYFSPYQRFLSETFQYSGQSDIKYYFDAESGELRFKPTQRSGEVSFTLKVENTYAFYCDAFFRNNGGAFRKSSTLGSSSLDMNILTLVSPEETSGTAVTVSGFAPGSSNVDIYLNDVMIGSATASAGGQYSFDVSLGNPTKSTGYTLKAVCADYNLTSEQFLFYRHNAPLVTEIKFFQDSEKDDYILMNGDESATVKYARSSNPYKFEITVDNSEFIAELYITSVLNGVKKRLDATYDPESGKYIAIGFFDENDIYYSPKEISVEYTLKSNAPEVGSSVDWDEIDHYLGSDFDQAVVTNQNEGSSSTGSVDFSSVDEQLQNLALNYAISAFDSVTGSNLGEVRSYYQTGTNIVSYIIPGLDDSRYYAYLDFSDPNTYKMLIDDGLDVGSKAVEIEMSFVDIHSGECYQLFEISQKLSNISTAVSYVSEIYNIQQDMQQLRDEVSMSDNVTDKTAAYQAIDELEKDQILFASATTVLPIIVAAGAAGGPAAMVFTGILGIMSVAANAVYQYRVGGITGKNVTTDWYKNVTVKQIGDDLFCERIGIWREHDNGVWWGDLELTIYGSGPMWNSPFEQYHWNTVTSLEILPGVTTISSGAFRYLAGSGLKSIVLPDTVVNIDDFAFADNKSIERIIIPDSVQMIGESAFAKCPNLQTVTLGNGLRELGTKAFVDCANLKSISLPDSLAKVGWCVFMGTGLESLVIPPNILSFACSWERIYEADGWSDPHTVGFLSHSNITRVSFAEGRLVIPQYALCAAKSVENVDIANSITDIGSSAFSGCENLSTICLPDGLLSIGDYAFDGCAQMTSIELPDGLKSIGGAAFDGTSIEELYIPSNVEKLGSDIFSAFSGMNSLKNVYISEDNPYLVLNDGHLIYNKTHAYIAYFGVLADDFYFPEGIETIASDVFEHSTYTGATLHIPASVNQINNYAFPILDGNLVWCVQFYGEAPNIDGYAFEDANILVRYPRGFYSWEEARKYKYGSASITWEAFTREDISQLECEVKDYKMLVYALDCANYYPEVRITVSNTLYINEPITIPENVEIHMASHYGSTVSADGSIVNNGYIYIDNWASVHVEEGGSITNNGKIEIAANGDLIVEGSYEGNPAIQEKGPNGSDGDAHCFSDLKQLIAANTTTIFGWGNIILEESLVIPENVSLYMQEGSSFVIPENLTLTVNGEFGAFGDSVQVDGSLVINGSLILFTEGDLTVSPGGSIVNNGDLGVYQGDFVVSPGASYDTGPSGTCMVYKDTGTVSGVDLSHITLIYPVTTEQELQDAVQQTSYKNVRAFIKGNFEITRNVVIPENMRLSIQEWEEEGYTVTVSSGVTLTNHGSIYVAVGSKLVFEQDARLINKGTVICEGQIVSDTLQIFSSPEDQNQFWKKTAEFYVGAIGSGIGYQWQYRTGENSDWQNCEAVSGTEPTLTVVVEADNDGYQYRCIVSDAAGNTLYSDIATLTVKYPHKLENFDTYALDDLLLGDDGIYTTPDGYTVYIAVHNVDDEGLKWLGNYTLYQYVTAYGETYFDLTHWEELMELMDENGYVVLTENTLEYLVVLTAGNPAWGETREDAKYYLAYDYSKENISECIHNYTAVVTEPTCTEQGYTTYTCLNCGHSYQDDYVEALGHIYGVWYIAAAATCTAEGLEQHDCERCDAYENREIPAKGHSYEDVVTDPTYEEMGYTTHTCTECGHSYVDNYVDAVKRYDVLDGDENSWNSDDGGDMSVRVDAKMELFVEVRIDGKIVLPDYYTISEGSTIVTLHEDYLATLPAGDHTMAIVFTDGMATSSFTVSGADAMLGDVDGNGEIDTTDAYLIVMYYNERMDLDEAQLLAADADGSGEVDTTDAYYIVMYYNERIDNFPNEN